MLPFEERKSIIENLSMVDEVISFDDDEHGSCINALEKIKKRFKNNEILFAMEEIVKNQTFQRCKLKELNLNLV